MQYGLANLAERPRYGFGSFIKKAVKKVTKPFKKVADKVIPKEIKPFVPAIAGMFLGPMAGSFLGGLGGTLGAKAGILGTLGRTLANPMISQGLGRALVDVGAQGLTSDRIDPLSAGLSGIMGAVSGYKGLPQVSGGGMDMGAQPSKFRIGLDKALRGAQKFTDPFGMAGGEGGGSLITAGKTLNVQGTIKSGSDEYDRIKKQAKEQLESSRQFTMADKAERRTAIIQYMRMAGFTEEQANEAASEEGYAFGGRVGLQDGGDIGLFGRIGNVLNPFDGEGFYTQEEMDRGARLNALEDQKQQVLDILRSKLNELNAIKEIGGSQALGITEEEATQQIDEILNAIGEIESGVATMGQNQFEASPRDEGIPMQMPPGQLDSPMNFNEGGRVPGLPPGKQVDAREGMFIPMGGAKRADDVPAMLSANEFVLNDDAVAGLGKLMTGEADPRAGARALYKIQDQLEAMV
jgi:hypothetical protein